MFILMISMKWAQHLKYTREKTIVLKHLVDLLLIPQPYWFIEIFTT